MTDLVVRVLTDINDGKKPTENDYGVELEEFGNALQFIKTNELATGLTLLFGGPGNKFFKNIYMNPVVTQRGQIYIRENA
ncbi:hypothetical protein M3221_13640 [Domibacillus indicus]|uniref:hypothetical protein n=1 Tax=Domibacillus indicus TaxID=1437523 RepID=UPI00203E5FF3|nr:hypothetical protein [Domibacillus indicus]MCM3789443.1 hypothetical protein [Domibacillus indicus]